jgi:D-xylose transport system substrate-binding protein
MIYLLGDTQAKTNDDKITIGLMVDSLVIERWQKDRDIFISRAKALGAEVILKNANEDAQLQTQQVKALIEAKVDVIVIIPYDRISIAPILKQAKREGIKIIAYDRLVHRGDVDLYMSFDNIEVGKLMGTSILEKAPTGNYVIINGAPKDNNAYMFNEGYMSALQPAIDAGKINVLANVWAEDWRELVAYDTISEIIDSGAVVDAIIGANDDLAEGAIRALLERQLAGSVFVSGHDANLSACQRIVEGTQTITIYKPIKKLAQKAAEMAVDLAMGKIITSDQTINDGEFDVPFIMFEPTLVDASNMVTEIIDDGFHLLEEVYRNIPQANWPKP